MRALITLIALTTAACVSSTIRPSDLRGADCLEAQHCEPAPFSACAAPTSPCVVEVQPDVGDLVMYYCDAGQPTCPRDTGHGTVLLGVKDPKEVDQ